MRKHIPLLIILALTIAVLIVAPMIGPRTITPGQLFGSGRSELESQIYWHVRLPRTYTAFATGIALALGGLALQALFRNPLATPYTLGVSSGASFGAVLYMMIPAIHFTVLGISGHSVFAFAGSILAITVIYGLTMARRGFSTATMLLAGVAVNFFFASLILLIQYLSGIRELFQIVRWLMGSLSNVGWETFLRIMPFAVGGAAIVFYMTRELNLLATGEEIAVSRGVNVSFVKKLVFFATSFMVGGVVAFCGPIGFIGMIVPHICRLIVGPDHRRLVPATLLFGGMFLTLCDTLARTVIAPEEMPVGVITSLLGGPFFVWLLVHGSSERRLV